MVGGGDQQRLKIGENTRKTRKEVDPSPGLQHCGVFKEDSQE